MAIPAVTCGADITYNWNSGAQVASLSAAATGTPDSWEWRILSVPAGLEALLTGVHGGFNNGVSALQNPTLPLGTNVASGTVVLQCIATNVDGSSDPTVDKANGQQCVGIRDQGGVLYPSDFEYDWGQRVLDGTIRIGAVKATPVVADVIVLEDSAASGARRRATVGSLPVATAAARGLLPILPGVTTSFLRGDGNWAAALDATAIHKATAAEISAIADKPAPVAADLLLIEDSAGGGYSKKRVQIGNLPTATVGAKGLLPILGGGTVDFLRADGSWAAPPGGGGLDTTAIHKAIAGEIAAMTDKSAPIGADLLVIEDSAGAAWSKKRINLSAIPGLVPLTTKGDLVGFSTVIARIPVGSNGKLLTADSTKAFGVEWAAIDRAAAAVQTTKGDLAGYTTAPERVPVGSNGQVLTADSTVALGLKWATPAASGGDTNLLLADDTQRDEPGLTYVTHKSFRFAMDAAAPWTAFRVAISLWHDTAASVQVRIAFDDPYGDAAVVTSTATAEDLQYVTIPWTGAVTKAFILGIVQLKRTGGDGVVHLKFLEIYGVK